MVASSVPFVPWNQQGAEDLETHYVIGSALVLVLAIVDVDLCQRLEVFL
jgi:hypothetical protein